MAAYPSYPFYRGDVAHLLPPAYKHMISAWLEEDCPSFDYGGFVVGEKAAEAKLLQKSKGIVAGIPFFDEVFKQLDCTYDILYLAYRTQISTSRSCSCPSNTDPFFSAWNGTDQKGTAYCPARNLYVYMSPLSEDLFAKYCSASA